MGDEKTLKRYRFPIFSASWSKYENSQSKEEDQENKNEKKKGQGKYIIMSGGGGEGRTGVENGLILARYDLENEELSESIHNYYTEDDCAYRMAVHPLENSIICSLSKGCRHFELKEDESAAGNVQIKRSDKSLKQLDNVGQQNSLVFSTDGTLLATGGDDGYLRVFEWPNLKIVLDQPEVHKSIRDLDFSSDGTLLASSEDGGPCRIWNLKTSTSEVLSSVGKDERIVFSRFSRDDAKPWLFTVIKQGDKGLIAYWDTHTRKKVGTRTFEKDPITTFNVSSDGKFLAVGTCEGDISVIQVSKMRIHQRVKGAHISFVTSLDFSQDSRLLLSASGVSSARVTRIEEQKQKDGNLLFLLMSIILAILAFFIVKYRGV
ncbi:hypothetical protein SUGI_0484610 [Cryptomeria japonica]|uniref:SEC12-like protein 2 n=1 Tax=Cryptomeria japonica TaxID=3369 RepID=UPI002408CF6D|nr:SEC12-like protein 2 [Cryptomeria japonica]GLJ25316.1 hypothetical protein SUGI_0484610 [Cryptomeria japonica]